jgi:predicted RNA-binding Zn-ribbon protein involved in translation (DUF1610 family)
MARKRSAEAANTSQSGGGEFVCPECGRTFTRAAALGAHRSRVHGVAGSSRRSQSRQRPTTRSSAGRRRTASSGGRTASGSSSGRRTTSRSSTRAPSDGAVDRDQLLQTLFPSGIPAKANVIRAVNSWLDDAERLARMR